MNIFFKFAIYSINSRIPRFAKYQIRIENGRKRMGASNCRTVFAWHQSCARIHQN